jgi:magnesium transporter
VDETKTVEFGEFHVFMGEDFVVTVRHGESSELGMVRHRVEDDRALLRLGPQAIVYAVIDRIVDDYAPVVDGLENDIDEIETEVFSGKGGVSRRIYQLSREVIQFQRATEPLPGILDDLIGHAGDPELPMYLRNVQGHALRITEHVGSFRELLQNILSVNLTLVGISQNEEVKGLTQASIAQADEVKMISAWAAILFAPTLVGAVYGMNFDHMPELYWTLGYPFALALMLIVSASLYLAFKRRGWL